MAFNLSLMLIDYAIVLMAFLTYGIGLLLFRVKGLLLGFFGFTIICGIFPQVRVTTGWLAIIIMGFLLAEVRIPASRLRKRYFKFSNPFH